VFKHDWFAMDELYEDVLAMIFDSHIIYRQELPKNPELLKGKIISIRGLIFKPLSCVMLFSLYLFFVMSFLYHFKTQILIQRPIWQLMAAYDNPSGEEKQQTFSPCQQSM
jgi:hypothetical protein